MSANSRFTVYNSDEVVITFGPVITQTGRGPDEFIRIEQESDDTEDIVGVDGEVALARSNDKRTDIVLTLLQTSQHNDQLSVISNLLRTAPRMAGGIVPFGIVDLNGRSLMTSANTWIKKPPDRTWGKVPGTVEWTLRASHLVRFDGGN